MGKNKRKNKKKGETIYFSENDRDYVLKGGKRLSKTFKFKSLDEEGDDEEISSGVFEL